MFAGPVRKQHAAACRDLEGARGMLIRPDLAQQPQADLRPCQRARIVVPVDLSALPCAPENFVAVDAKPVATGKLFQNEKPPRRPFPVA